MKFYIYEHIRRDTKEVFYVGKGTGKRAYVKNNRNNYWHHIVQKTQYDIKIVADNLTESEAFAQEVQYIKMYKQIGLCVANLTDGGEGTSGYRYTGELLEIHRKQVLFHMNRPEVKIKISEIKKAQYQNNPDIKNQLRISKLKSIQEKPEQVSNQKKSLKKFFTDMNNREFSAVTHGGKSFIAIDKFNNEIMWRGINQKICAETLHLQQSNINKCLKGLRKSTGDYRFEYVN